MSQNIVPSNQPNSKQQKTQKQHKSKESNPAKAFGDSQKSKGDDLFI